MTWRELLARDLGTLFAWFIDGGWLTLVILGCVWAALP